MFENLKGDVVSSLSLLLLGIVLFYLAKRVFDKVTPYSSNEELAKCNLAHGFCLAGYLLGVVSIFIGVLSGPSHGIVQDLQVVGGYTALGIILLNLSRWINDKLILHRFCDIKEIVEDRNIGTGAVHFGASIASGLIVAGAVHGEGGGVHTVLAFFALGQLALVIFTRVFCRLMPYDVQTEIEKDNVAAGAALGGTLIALGILLMFGTRGNFVSWEHNLLVFAVEGLLGLLVLPFVRIAMDRILIPHMELNRAIVADRNVAAGLLEMIVVICFAAILGILLDFDILVGAGG